MNDEILFVDEDASLPERASRHQERWKILIVDDEQAVHQVTELALRRVEFEGLGLEFINAYSGHEARQILSEQDDIAVVLLDIIMETVNAGLEVAEYIRHTLNNFTTRIILRTGQPGDTPEREVILNYEIDGYKTKTELTAQRLFSEIMTSLRSYRDLRLVRRHSASLEVLVGAMSAIYQPRTIEAFVAEVLAQLAKLLPFATADGQPGHYWAVEYTDDQLRFLGGTAPVEAERGADMASALPVELVARIRDANWHKRSFFGEGGMVLVGQRCREPALTLCVSGTLPPAPSDRYLLDIFSGSVETAFENLRLSLENEQHRQHLEQRVEARTRDLAAARERLYHAERMASIGQLAAGVAHEINNPLAFISSNLAMVDDNVGKLLALIDTLGAEVEAGGLTPRLLSELCESCGLGYLREEVPEVMVETREGVSRITEIVRALREFADLDACEKHEIDINDLVRQVVGNIPPEQRKGVDVRCELADLPELLAVPEQLSQALGNILRNAVEAAGSGGRVSVHTRSRGSAVEVEVEDNGGGITAEALSRVFDPFYTTKAVGQGMGLGLSLAYGVVKQHGGEIGVESPPGQGTRVRVSLPLA